MPAQIRPYPIIKGKDAERFLERQKENKQKLNKHAKAFLEKHPGYSQNP